MGFWAVDFLEEFVFVFGGVRKEVFSWNSATVHSSNDIIRLSRVLLDFRISSKILDDTFK